MAEQVLNLHHGDRLMLPETETEEDVEIFVGGAGFKPGRQHSTPYGFEKVWVISGQLYFHYVYDSTNGNAYVRVTGDALEAVRRFTGLARTFFSAVDVDTLVAGVHDAGTPDELASALTRLAVGMPSDASPEALRLIHDGFTSADPVVRRGALLSALYLDWPAVRPHVMAMADHDDAETLRLQAGYFVDKHEGTPR